jgi:2-polyprenyl-3-methyl-5-hydroxy-6-metoxy-1,4-benzoquinol methylase
MLKIEGMALTPFKGASVMDVGCGTGDFSKILRLNHIDSYTGIDIYAPAIKTAKERYPNETFKVADILKDPIAEKFDYVFCSGAMSLELKEINNYDFVANMVEKMWKKTSSGLVFNVLTDINKYQHKPLFYYNTDRIMKILPEVAPDARIKHLRMALTHYGSVPKGKDWIAQSHFYLFHDITKRTPLFPKRATSEE